MEKNESIIVFGESEIRRAWHNEEWWFCIYDIVKTLSGSSNPPNYIKDMRRRDKELGKKWQSIVELVNIDTKGGKQKLSCSNTEGIFRIIQSIPSPKAEPFKTWLARVAVERIREIENPELAQERMKKLYEQKGYPKNWIDKRLRSIAIRQNLTDEWQERGITKQTDYAILTAEISKATFGMTPAEYKSLKNIPERSKINLRDNMTDLELIFTMLGEKVTTEISQNEQPDSFEKNKTVAKRGGKVAGNARKDTERELGRSIITSQNFLELIEESSIEDQN